MENDILNEVSCSIAEPKRLC